MKCFVIIAFAVICVSSTLGQTNIDKLTAKNDGVEKGFNDNLKTKETELFAYRRANQDKVNAAIDKLKKNIKDKKISRCYVTVRWHLLGVQNRLRTLINEISDYYNPRKYEIVNIANTNFKADRDAANSLKKKYKACAEDQTCKDGVNKEVDAKLAEPINTQCVADTNILIERTRKYSGIATTYLEMRVDYLQKDLDKCA